MKSYTSIVLSSCAQALKAANTVDGGQVWSSSAAENRAGAVPRAAKCTPSKYDRVRRTSAALPRWVLRKLPISRYGLRSVRVVARGKSHRNGTSGAMPARSGTSPPTAIVMPPPWLAPTATVRLASASGCDRAASTARTASVNTRR
ncbi:hypothetical protein STENM223S_02664 [Streptomyces tendae]